MKEMVSALLSDDATRVADAAVYFRKVLAVGMQCLHSRDSLITYKKYIVVNTDRHPPVDEIVDAGILPRMIELLQIAPISVVFEISWCITNVACGELHHTKALVSCGALPVLAQLLSSSADNVR
jgi:hypothetical protein